jgi:hypothetical protein
MIKKEELIEAQCYAIEAHDDLLDAIEHKIAGVAVWRIADRYAKCALHFLALGGNINFDCE